MKNLTLLILASVFLFSCNSDKEETPPTNLPEVSEIATYRITFQGTWSTSSHPTDYPSNSHFSGVIGMTHSIDTSIVTTGDIASEGIKVMAETGGKTPLTNEINDIIEKGNANLLISESGLSTGSDNIIFEIEVNKNFPYLSLFSMIAPSPDWYVTINKFNLYDDEEWVESITIQPMHLDAGTDSGTTFTSPNTPTTPQEVISQITNAPLGNGEMVTPSVATFTIERIK
ncbi:spondin domain-containing protein [Flammeovirga pacifica]|uniref:Spondin domain-containing protein n=1 Tax=Flammeovirga pacifica TaxID=915059 RepID=A0A1S1Z3D1_FLAPC|nr:spondin domain-containing protein [Flammeovirga pacifica]OHX67585.1 hypothetical protein NH26_15120 [Flammeovirga pacifica]